MKHTHTIQRFYVIKDGIRRAANESLKGLRVDIKDIDRLRKYLSDWYYVENVDFELKEYCKRKIK